MKSNKEILVTFIFIILSMALFFPVILAEEGNYTRESAELALNESKEIMNRLANDDFPVIQINDTIKEAEKVFEAQKVLEEQDKNPDYFFLHSSLSKVKDIQEEAYYARDSIYTLNLSFLSYKEKAEKYAADTSEVDLLIEEVLSEFYDERFERAAELAQEAETRVLEEDASLTTVNVFYGAVTLNIQEFFINNYKTILLIIAGVILFIILFGKQMRRMVLKRKLKNLKIEKGALIDMLKETQMAYFHDESMADSIYKLRIKKFAELARDIDRQIPLLEEQLARFNKNTSFYTKENIKKTKEHHKLIKNNKKDGE